MFSPLSTQDGPANRYLEDERITTIQFEGRDPFETRDEWRYREDDRVGEQWTGKTVFWVRAPVRPPEMDVPTATAGKAHCAAAMVGIAEEADDKSPPGGNDESSELESTKQEEDERRADDRPKTAKGLPKGKPGIRT